MAKRCVPGIAKWDMYAGGTSCPSNVHNYGITMPKGNYKVSCLAWPNGRMRGYLATFENVKGLARRPGLHQRLYKDGSSGDQGDFFRSPASGAAAAEKHCERMNAGLDGSRRRRRRGRRR
jgi:cation transport regulator ChaC